MTVSSQTQRDREWEQLIVTGSQVATNVGTAFGEGIVRGVFNVQEQRRVGIGEDPAMPFFVATGEVVGIVGKEIGKGILRGALKVIADSADRQPAINQQPSNGVYPNTLVRRKVSNILSVQEPLESSVSKKKWYDPPDLSEGEIACCGCCCWCCLGICMFCYASEVSNFVLNQLGRIS